MKLEVQRALEAIYERDGVLSARAVVKAAKPVKSPLHSLFDWDDATAAEAHRLNQARQLIRIAVVVIPSVANAPVRQFVSLSALRRNGSGSYLATVDIVGDDARREVALNDALTTLQSLQRRFRYLPELTPIWDALAVLTTQELTDETQAA